MIYCMSDIHGEYDRFQSMLKLIQFSSEDTIYIIGDVIDRHPNGVDILQDIIATPNIKMILGNHEDMCLKTLGRFHQIGARDLWKSNGGSSTYRDLVYHHTEIGKKQILDFLELLPTHLQIEIGERKFELVHGWPANNDDDRIWARPGDLPMCLPDGVIPIIGHTPTSYLEYDDGESPLQIKKIKYEQYDREFIAIDCGCGNKTSRRRLACLRLDDMHEFYV